MTSEASHADVVIAGAPATAPKANGLVGRVVQMLDYRGRYERLRKQAGIGFPGTSDERFTSLNARVVIDPCRTR